MPNYRAHGQRDETSIEDGDAEFLRIDMRDPATIGRGCLSDGRNIRLLDRSVDTRGGIQKLPWTNRIGGPDTDQVLPFGTIYGVGEFSDPNGEEWTLVAADGKVYKLRESNMASEVNLPLGLTITSEVNFTQTFSGVAMFRGESLPQLQLSDLDTGFEAIVSLEPNTISGGGTENPTDGTEPMPPAVNGEWIGNRLFVPHSRDLLDISDFLNPTRFQPVRSQGRINQGSSDSLVRFFKFSETAGLAFKSGSIYQLLNIKADLTDMILDDVTREYGLCAAKAVVNVGANVWFLVQGRGVCSIEQSAQGKLRGVDIPISAPIQKVISRINWNYAGAAVAATYENRVYFAVPLDDATVLKGELVPAGNYSGAPTTISGFITGKTYRYVKGANETNLVNGVDTLTDSADFVAAGPTVTLAGTNGLARTASIMQAFIGVNNAVLVYNLVNDGWESIDQGTAIMVQNFVKIPYDGQRRLFFFSNDGYINLYEEGAHDEVQLTSGVVIEEIQYYALSRGYTCWKEDGSRDQSSKRFHTPQLAISTWAPQYTLVAITDGVGERTVLTQDETKSRVKYYKPWDRPDYDATNVNGDHGEPYREDYSVELPGDSDGINMDAGVDLDLFQDSREGMKEAKICGRYMQVEVANSQGRIKVRSIEIFAQAGQRRAGVLV